MFSVLPVLHHCVAGELGQLEMVAILLLCVAIASKTKTSCKNVNIIIIINYNVFPPIKTCTSILGMPLHNY